MLFDRLLGIVEAHLRDFIPILEKARIFEFPIIPHSFLPKRFEDDMEWFEENFFLPFPVVAVEDKASCIVLFDTKKDQKGVYDKRGFIECMSLSHDISAFRESLEPNKKENTQGITVEHYHSQGFAVVEVGCIYKMRFSSRDKFFGEGAVYKTMLASKREKKWEDFPKDIAYGIKGNNDSINGPITNAYTALQEIYYFNRPDKFILEESPTKIRKKPSKLLRSFERPKYTILNPDEIRRKMGLPQVRGSHNSPIPHERRRHDRWLSDDRYGRDGNGDKRMAKVIPYGPRKGEPYFLHVDVPATWIGPYEKKKGNKYYRVLINK